MIVQFTSLDRVLDWLIATLLAMLLLFMPLTFGAVEAWSVAVISCTLAFSLLLLTVKLLRPGTRVAFSWAYLPVAVFVLWVGAQLLPLPGRWVDLISPHTLATRRALIASLPNVEGLLRRLSLSFYPLGTRRDLRTILCAAAVFVIVLHIARTPQRFRFILGAIALSGGIVAALALAQDATHADKLYWRIPAVQGPYRAISGPFVNHSHFGQFMNLSMGAALALLLPMLAGGNATKRARGFSLSQVSIQVALVALLICGAATIAWSRTRGGVLSMAVAALVAGTALLVRRGIRGNAIPLAGLLVAVLCCAAIFSYFVKHDTGGASERMLMARDAMSAWRQFPLAGIGLGAHETVFPMFNAEVSTAVATHLENEYLQVLEETGIVGLAMLLLFLAIIARNGWTAAARQRGNEGLAAFGLAYGLVAVLVHSFTDFGQHLAGNACLTAALCGLMASLAHKRAGTAENPQAKRAATPEPVPSSIHSARSSLLRAALGATFIFALTGAAIWAALSAVNAAKAEAHWDSALAAESRVRANGWKGPRTQRLLDESSAAVALEPDNVVYRYWQAVYLWRTRRASGQAAEPPSASTVHELAQDVAARLQQALPLCPTYGPAHAMLGQLMYFSLKQPEGVAEIELGYRLAGYDANSCFAAGVAAARLGHDAEAVERLRRAVRLDVMGMPERIIAVIFREMRRPRIAVDSLSESDFALTQLFHDLQKNPEPTALVAECKPMLDATIKERFAAPDAPAYALAHLGSRYFDEGNYQQALVMYRRCAALDARGFACRQMVAQCLAKLDRKAEAIDLLHDLLRENPSNAEALRLLNYYSASH